MKKLKWKRWIIALAALCICCLICILSDNIYFFFLGLAAFIVVILTAFID